MNCLMRCSKHHPRSVTARARPVSANRVISHRKSKTYKRFRDCLEREVSAEWRSKFALF
jgi:hypothetical protein